MNGFFVTATDTGVGKTVFTAALAARLREAGHDVVAIKPIASGATVAGGTRVSSDALFLEWAARSGHVLSVDFDREWVTAQVLNWLESHVPRA